jgi:hypothetical protein
MLHISNSEVFIHVSRIGRPPKLWLCLGSIGRVSLLGNEANIATSKKSQHLAWYSVKQAYTNRKLLSHVIHSFSPWKRRK